MPASGEVDTAMIMKQIAIVKAEVTNCSREQTLFAEKTTKVTQEMQTQMGDFTNKLDTLERTDASEDEKLRHMIE